MLPSHQDEDGVSVSASTKLRTHLCYLCCFVCSFCFRCLPLKSLSKIACQASCLFQLPFFCTLPGWMYFASFICTSSSARLVTCVDSASSHVYQLQQAFELPGSLFVPNFWEEFWMFWSFKERHNIKSSDGVGIIYNRYMLRIWNVEWKLDWLFPQFPIVVHWPFSGMAYMFASHSLWCKRPSLAQSVKSFLHHRLFADPYLWTCNMVHLWKKH